MRRDVFQLGASLLIIGGAFAFLNHMIFVQRYGGAGDPPILPWGIAAIGVIVATAGVLMRPKHEVHEQQDDETVTIPEKKPETEEPSLQMRFCGQCGAKISRDNKFCEQCGAKLLEI